MRRDVGALPLLLWIVGLSGAIAYGWLVYGPKHNGIRHMRVTVPVSGEREPWAGDEYERARDAADEPDVPEPEEVHPSYSWALGFARRIDCPKCAAGNVARRKAGLDPLPQRLRLRASDRALYCSYHDETFYPCSEDTVIRYDPRFHRQTPDDQQEAA